MPQNNRIDPLFFKHIIKLFLRLFLNSYLNNEGRRT